MAEMKFGNPLRMLVLGGDFGPKRLMTSPVAPKTT